MVTRSWGYECSWSLGNCMSTQTYSSYSSATVECCQPEGTYLLSCFDSYGDGWHGGYLLIGGTNYCGSFGSGSLHTQSATWSANTGEMTHQ